MVLRLLPLAMLIGATSIAAQVPTRTPARAATVVDSAATTRANAGWFGFRQILRGDTLTVLEVASGSPAERAGLQPGDRILTIDGRTVNERQLNDWFAPVGAPRKMTVIRGGQTLSLSMVAAAPPRGVLAPSRAMLTNPDTVASEARQLRGRMALQATRAPTITGTADSMNISWSMSERRSRGDSSRVDSLVRYQRLRTVGGQKPLIVVDGVIMTADSTRQLRLTSEALTNGELYNELRQTLESTNATVARLARSTNAISGAEFEELNPGLAEYFYGVSEGVFVLRVANATPAAAAGLRPGDIVQEVNGDRVNSVTELRSAVSEASGTIALRVLRKGTPATVTLRKD